MSRLDTARYRRQLVSFHENLSVIDGKAARVVAKWIYTLDEISLAGTTTKSLLDQINSVHRTATAFSILAESQISKESYPGISEVLEANVAHLSSEISSLRKECTLIEGVISDRGLQMIVGEFLSSVTFVMDYIQLDFCGYVLTAYVDPVVSLSSSMIRMGDQGYRDSLCALISEAMKVMEVEEVEGHEIRIRFLDGRYLSLSLRPEDAQGPENVGLTSPSGLWMVW